MMYHIRPWRLFDLVPDRAAPDRLVHMKIPIRRVREFPDYSLRLLELMCVIACIKIVGPDARGARRLFEFGTFCGNSTFHMALNSADDAEIWTLDADEETLRREGLEGVYSWRRQFPMEFAGTEVARKIHTLTGDSHLFLPPDFLLGTTDLILVDGDHGTPGVCIDTRTAHNMLSFHGCILWHDYRNPGCHENTVWLDHSAATLDLFHIEDTTTVIYFRDQALAERLKALG